MMLGMSDAGFANIISIGALLVAGLALFWQWRTTRQSAALEKERHDMVLADRYSAHVSVRLFHYKDRSVWELAIENTGPSSARDIGFSARALKAPDLDLRLTNERNLPIAVLQAGGRITLPAEGASWKVGPPFEITLSWTDDRLGRQRETHTITDEQGIDQPPFEAHL